MATAKITVAYAVDALDWLTGLMKGDAEGDYGDDYNKASAEAATALEEALDAATSDTPPREVVVAMSPAAEAATCQTARAMLASIDERNEGLDPKDDDYDDGAGRGSSVTLDRDTRWRLNKILTALEA